MELLTIIACVSIICTTIYSCKKLDVEEEKIRNELYFKRFNNKN